MDWSEKLQIEFRISTTNTMSFGGFFFLKKKKWVGPMARELLQNKSSTTYIQCLS
jgi:hypothetical protein